jgi:hypothetical protein
MSSFAASNSIGKWAVERVTTHLRNITDWELYNVEDDLFFRSLDVDLIARTGSGETLLLEVKGDRYLSGNIYIETVSNRTKNTPGCLLYTCADYLIYYFVKAGFALVIPVTALQEWIPANIKRFPRHNPTTTSGGKVIFDSEGHTVPITTLVEEIPGIQTFHFLEEMQ